MLTKAELKNILDNIGQILISAIFVLGVTMLLSRALDPEHRAITPNEMPVQIQQAEAEGNAFEKVTVIDNEDAALYLTGLSPNAFLGYAVNISAENKNANEEIYIEVKAASVNDMPCRPLFYMVVQPGKTKNGFVRFPKTMLTGFDVTSYKDIEINFCIGSLKDGRNIANGIANIYPYGKEDGDNYTIKPEESDTIIWNEEELQAVITGHGYDDEANYMLKLFLVNNTDQDIIYSARKARINGSEIDPHFICLLPTGESTFVSIMWPAEELEEKEITDVQEIKMNLLAYSYEGEKINKFARKQMTLRVDIVD